MISKIKSGIIHVIRTVRSVVKDATTKRSSRWPAVEHAHIQKEPSCAVCGGGKNLNVHHILPFHLSSDLELDPNNLITLCMVKGKHCHLLIGHGDDFKAYNANVRHDAQTLRQYPGLFKALAGIIKQNRSY